MRETILSIAILVNAAKERRSGTVVCECDIIGVTERSNGVSSIVENRRV